MVLKRHFADVTLIGIRDVHDMPVLNPGPRWRQPLTLTLALALGLTLTLIPGSTLTKSNPNPNASAEPGPDEG